MDIPGILRFATVADPHGAVFILYKALREARRRAGRTTPAFSAGANSGAGEGPKAFDFYSGLFGWTKAEPWILGPMGVYQTFAAERNHRAA